MEFRAACRESLDIGAEVHGKESPTGQGGRDMLGWESLKLWSLTGRQAVFLKKEPKNFRSLVVPCGGVRDSGNKSFLLLFFKKAGLGSFACFARPN